MRKVVLLAVCAPAVLSATTYFITIAGLGGEPDYEQRFPAWAMEIDSLLKKAGGDAKSEVLAGENATRDKLTAVLANLAKTAKPQDALVLMMIGHGGFDGVEYKINLPGPDISAVELASLLDRVPTGRQLVVNMTSASGACLDVLRKDSRAVITATKSGTEKNATIFARYWAEALRDPAADTDKNEVITALEAFRYAADKTAKFYETQKRIATEHPMLEDTGKASGVRTPSPENGEGLLTSRFILVRLGSGQTAALSGEKQKLLAKKEDLEQRIDSLKYQKAAMPEPDYKRQIAVLLLELAKTQAELDK